MSGEIKLCYTISKEAYKLVKEGKAVLSSGGVRASQGKQLIELAKPAVKAASGSLSSPLTLISSLGNNVQSAFIQKGVNKANVKLDTTLDKLDILQNSVNALAVNGTLSWVNCALGIVNCGVTIGGFALTLNELNIISDKMDKLKEKIDYNNISELLERFDEYRGLISEDIGRMDSESYSVLQNSDVADHLQKIYAFLKRIIRDFEHKKIPGELACNIIFSLAPAFAREVKEYAARYYYEKEKFPPNYKEWVDLLRHIVGNDFTERYKSFLQFDCMELSTEERYVAYGSVMYSIQYQLSDLEFGKQVVQRLEKKDFFRLDDYLMERIGKSDYIEDGDKICITI